MKYLFVVVLALLGALSLYFLWHLPTILDLALTPVSLIAAFFCGYFYKRGIIDV